MWEDWALFLKLASSGHKIGIIPQVDCLYRVRKQSMLRTYKVWPAMRRLARNTAGLSRFEGFRLQAFMRHAREEENATRAEIARLNAEGHVMRSGLVRICEEHAVLTVELNRRSVRAARSIVARLMHFPHMFGAVHGVCLAVWKSARRLRDLTASKQGK